MTRGLTRDTRGATAVEFALILPVAGRHIDRVTLTLHALYGMILTTFLVVSFTSDWLYPSYHSKELVRALHAVGADVTYLDIESTWGHDAFLLEVDTMTRLLASFLDRLADEEGVARP